MAPREWYAVNIRMPQTLRKALRRLSYLTEVSINQIMVEALAHHLVDWTIGETGVRIADPQFIAARSDAEVKTLLRKAKKEIGQMGFEESIKFLKGALEDKER